MDVLSRYTPDSNEASITNAIKNFEHKMIAYAIYSLIDLTKNSSSPFEQKVEKLQQAIDVNLIEKERQEAEEEAKRQVVAYWSDYESKLPSLGTAVSTARNAQ